MVRKLFCAMVVMVVAIGFVAADDFSAVIKGVAKDGKVTFYKAKTKTTDKGEVTTLATDAKTAVLKGTSKKGVITEGDAIKDWQKDETFTKIDEKKGLSVRLYTEGKGADEKITKIVVTSKVK